MCMAKQARVNTKTNAKRTQKQIISPQLGIQRSTFNRYAKCLLSISASYMLHDLICRHTHTHRHTRNCPQPRWLHDILVHTVPRIVFNSGARTKPIFIGAMLLVSFIHLCRVKCKTNMNNSTAQRHLKNRQTTASERAFACSFARTHTHCSFDWLKSPIMWYWLCSGESVMKCVRFYFFLRSFAFRMCMFTSFLCMFFLSLSRCYVVCFVRLFSVFFCLGFFILGTFLRHFTRATRVPIILFHCCCSCSSNTTCVVVVGAAIGSFVHTYQLIMQLIHPLQFILVSFSPIHFRSHSRRLLFAIKVMQCLVLNTGAVDVDCFRSDVLN